MDDPIQINLHKTFSFGVIFCFQIRQNTPQTCRLATPSGAQQENSTALTKINSVRKELVESICLCFETSEGFYRKEEGVRRMLERQN